MGILQGIAFILVYIGFHFNSKEMTKSISYVIWIISNSILALIAAIASLPIISLMYIGLIFMLLYNLYKTKGLIKLLQQDNYRDYRIVQETEGFRIFFTIESSYVILNSYFTKWKTLKDTNGNNIVFDELENAILFKNQHKDRIRGIKRIVG